MKRRRLLVEPVIALDTRTAVRDLSLTSVSLKAAGSKGPAGIYRFYISLHIIIASINTADRPADRKRRELVGLNHLFHLKGDPRAWQILDYIQRKHAKKRMFIGSPTRWSGLFSAA
ncbi:hypothetical protein [Achromobacter denitrificans]|uniref:Uncharacterized protein n=1 Tax=Achromobacter denitrificans TaxID=32002 RepID=A0ABZ3FWG3_ACHDE|nr:hypothetical protein EC609_19605 [Achromobacter denitrificans]